MRISKRQKSAERKDSTFAPNAERSLFLAVVFKDTNSFILDNPAFIVRSVGKATTATMATKFTWINIKELSISVDFAPNHLHHNRTETITHLFTQESIVSTVTSVVQASTKNNSTTSTSPYTVREGIEASSLVVKFDIVVQIVFFVQQIWVI